VGGVWITENLTLVRGLVEGEGHVRGEGRRGTKYMGPIGSTETSVLTTDIGMLRNVPRERWSQLHRSPVM
jgi:hypothetical protein